ncbi:P-loop containing nucleoside triphosphate hydrolase protein [Dendrothele bispora CBS 962.96]|uniref:P-loop containing nucleoside triphosphate hydrolase protein n=1 Tax=Dendrothele bispora (strain CBS 962.96) TaxID=1314807 RepID=A0A4V4HCV0_DENBC|nr:P-loop containing nucleoside triphosphate hydrolase protein [Dendrothele bispora CBS 962.96]
MGASGSGKTTFLNVLSHRMGNSSALSLSGVVLYNGNSNLSSVTSAYVSQQDYLLPCLTVRETLFFSASLRLPYLSTSEARDLVERVILELGLKECANTRVGDGKSRGGCSGGERRRVSIGVQLLSNPSVLFCDEPTTGLDATSAYQLMYTLKSLANKGRTIICTIHQPRHDIYYLFNEIMLLSKGRTLYTGPTARAAPWFEHLVPGCSTTRSNPADDIVMVAAVDCRSPEAEVTTRARLDMLTQAWTVEAKARFPDTKYVSQSSITNISTPLKSSRTASVARQIWVLTYRDVLSTLRDPMGLIACWLGAIILGVVLGFAFLKIPRSLSGIRSREAALYSGAGMQIYVIFIFEMLRLANKDVRVLDREREEGIVDVVPWIVSRRAAHALLEDIMVPLLFGSIFYFMCGFDANAAQFFKFYFIFFLDQLTAVSFAMFCVSLSRDFVVASAVGNVLYTLMNFAGGFVLQADSIPVYLRWIKWISFPFYSFAALMVNEFTDQLFDCPLGDPNTDSDCVQYSGNFVLRSFSLTPGWFAVPMGALIGFIVFFNLGSGFLNQIKSGRFRLATQHSAGDEIYGDPKRKVDIVETEKRSTAGVDLEVIDLGLTVKKFSARSRRSKCLPILQGVSSRFSAGEVNVIMGPSGSGKSSLLNLICSRLPSTAGYFSISGSILIDGHAARPEDLEAMCCYVTQGDGLLLPYLTVREILYSAARLRLPQSMNKAQKRERVEQVILQLGLRDCADNLIGDESIKGISGGEKRRVSVAIQLLGDPRILIADEPTSGLDAFAASSIMDVLSTLAREGRTVIATIHQSRSELFHQFNHLTLLTKGGRVAYSGSAGEMIPYFASLGYYCPQDCNPSDWVLDLVSIDLRDSDAELNSRSRVDKILNAYTPPSGPTCHIKERGDLLLMKKQITPIHVAFPAVFERGLISLKRQPNVISTRIVQVVFLGGLLALYFAPLGRGFQDANVNIVGLIQDILPFYFVGVLQNVAVYPSERDAFYKEFQDRACPAEAFFLVYTLLEMPLEVIASLLFSLLGCIATNLRRTVAMYFIIALNCFCIVNCGESVGIIFNTIFFDSTEIALDLTGVVISIAQNIGGLFTIDMPGLLKAFNYISPMKYAVANMMVYTLQGVKFDCDDSEKLSDGSCAFRTGEDVLRLYKLDNVDGGKMLAGLVGITIAYRIVAYGVLKLRLAMMHHRIFRK